MAEGAFGSGGAARGPEFAALGSGGAIIGGVVFKITADGSAVRASLEEAKALAQQASPQIQKALTYQVQVDTSVATRQLQQFEQQAQQSNAVLRRIQEQQAANPVSFERAAIPTIGTETSGPLAQRGALNLPQINTQQFTKSTEEAVASLRTIETEGVGIANRVASAFDAAGPKIAGIGQKIAGSFTSGFAGAVVALVAFEAAVSTFEKIVDAGQEALRVQYALGRAFGANTSAVTNFAQQTATSLGQTTIAFESSLTELGRIGQVVGLTTGQIERLATLAADISAITGRSQEQAAHALGAAFIGQPRGLDLLGIPATNAVLKASDNLTEAQKKHVTQLELSTKAQALYNLILEESGGFQNAAAERTRSDAGAFDRLNVAAGNLATTLGTGISPAVVRVADAMTASLNATNLYIAGLAKIPSDITTTLHIVIPDVSNLPGAGNAGQAATGALNLLPGGSPIAAQVAAIARASSAQLELGAIQEDDIRRSRVQDDLVAARVAGLGELTAAQLYYNQAQAASQHADPDTRSAEGEKNIAEGIRVAADEEKRLADAKQKALDITLQQVVAEGQAADYATRMLASHQADLDALNKQSGAINDVVRSALEAAKPADRDALAKALQGVSVLPSQAIEAGVNADPVQKARDAARAVADAQQQAQHDQRKADQQAQAANDESTREREANLRQQEQAAIEAIRLKEKADVGAVQSAETAERDRHQSVMQQIQDETTARHEQYQQQLRAIQDAQQADDRAAQDKANKDRLTSARIKLDEALSGPGHRPSDAAFAAIQAGEAPPIGAGLSGQRRKDIADAAAQLRQTQDDLAKQKRDRDRQDQTRSIQDQEAAFNTQEQQKQRAEDRSNQSTEQRLQAAAKDLQTGYELQIVGAQAQQAAAQAWRQAADAWNKIGVAPPAGSLAAGPKPPEPSGVPTRPRAGQPPLTQGGTPLPAAVAGQTSSPVPSTAIPPPAAASGPPPISITFTGNVDLTSQDTIRQVANLIATTVNDALAHTGANQ